MLRMASLYKRSGKVFVMACHRTVAGFWILDQTISVLCSDDPISLQNTTCEALNRSCEEIPNPPRDKNHMSALLSATGTKSCANFVKGTKLVNVYLRDNTIDVTPNRNLGAKEGFTPISARITRVPKNSPVLGAMLLEAFNVAE
jgi:hypothetical protein